MKLAFLGEIHGNLPALEAVLEDLEGRPVDGIFHLGDVVGYGPQPAGVIRRLQELGIDGVRGNHDERVAHGGPVPVGREEDDTDSLAAAVCAWTRERLGASQRDWLDRLPFQKRIASPRMSVALFHSTPVSFLWRPHQEQGDDFFDEMGLYTGASVNIFATTHVPFWKVVRGRWFVNVGSVGLPGDGDPRAAYAIVDLNGGAAVRIVRVDYDRKKTAHAVRAAELPAGILRLLGEV